MNQLTEYMREILAVPKTYDNDIRLLCDVLSYIPYFEDANEVDYIKYHDDNSFEYTPQFYSFIKALFDSKIVEDVEDMTTFLKRYSSQNAYKIWMKEMNTVLSNDNLMSKVNLCFIRKAIFSMVRLEKVMPGSWGIDVETGNWLRLLQQIKVILPEVYKPNKQNMN